MSSCLWKRADSFTSQCVAPEWTSRTGVRDVSYTEDNKMQDFGQNLLRISVHHVSDVSHWNVITIRSTVHEHLHTSSFLTGFFIPPACTTKPFIIKCFWFITQKLFWKTFSISDVLKIFYKCITFPSVVIELHLYEDSWINHSFVHLNRNSFHFCTFVCIVLVLLKVVIISITQLF